MATNEMKQFDQFWADLHDALDSPVRVHNWTAAKKQKFRKTFSVWSGRGSFAQRVLTGAGHQPTSTALYCRTLKEEGIRIIHLGEARKIFAVWPQYVSKEMPRNKIRAASKNLTYIFGIFHKFENLMHREDLI